MIYFEMVYNHRVEDAFQKYRWWSSVSDDHFYFLKGFLSSKKDSVFLKDRLNYSKIENVMYPYFFNHSNIEVSVL